VKIPESNMIRCINPHHDDKTPSMYIYDEINIAKCFGRCNKGYDTIEIVRAIDGKEFEDAVMFLYNKFTALMIGHLQKKKKLNIELYIKLNKELKHIFNIVKNDKKMRIRAAKVMQIIDLHPEKNLLILKLYQQLLREIS
jgi:DNA primase